MRTMFSFQFRSHLWEDFIIAHSSRKRKEGNRILKTERLKVRVSPETKEKLLQLAASEGVPVTGYIQHLIHREIQKRRGAVE